MSRRLITIISVVASVGLAVMAALTVGLMARTPKASAATCAPTGFYRDSVNMTAAMINPTGTVSGEVNASGCNIGVFYSAGSTGTVDGADIHNANYFSVVNDGGDVTVQNSSIHDIGESPLNGDQHGVGVYWAYGAGGTGSITHNHIWNYQKGGIVVNGAGSVATVSNNTVMGQGPVDYIAQNGIEIGLGASATVMRNTVTGNSYTGTSASSAGILVFGGPCYGGDYATNTQIVGNTLVNNDVGVWISNVEADCASAPTTMTNVKVINNTISDDAVTNGYIYQAGVSDQGDNDKIIHNTISGAGYGPVNSGNEYLIPIDAGSAITNRAKVHANVTM